MLLVACADFLDVMPEATLTDKKFYKSADDFDSALTAAYSSLTDAGIFGESMYLFTEVRSDNAFPKNNKTTANLYRYEIDEFYITANNKGNTNFWQHHYRGAVRANIVINYGAEVMGGDPRVQSYIAEAKVLRALFYFNLVRAYGPVPLVLNVPREYADTRGHDRRPVAEVYARIITDLKEAIESGKLRTDKYTALGHVNLYAAEALLGKVFLQMPDAATEAAYPELEPWKDISADPLITPLYPEGSTTKWEAARHYLSHVATAGGYSLAANFADLFKPANKHNSESIWEVEYKADLLTTMGSPFYTHFAPLNYNPDGVTPKGSDGIIAPAVAVKGLGNCAPTGNLMDASKKWDSMWPDYVTQVTLYDGAAYNDKRVSDGAHTGTGASSKPVNTSKDHPQSLDYPYNPYTGTTWTPVIPGWGSDADFMCGKYRSGSSVQKNDSDDNWYLIRYADVLLMLAEAENEINGPNAETLNYINQVRRRAGIVEISEGSGAEWKVGSSDKERMRALILDERRLELAFEGHRWFDLVHSGKAVEVMNKHFSECYNAYISNTQIGSVNQYIMKSKLVIINPRTMLFPIPNTEILVNLKLYQNEGAR